MEKKRRARINVSLEQLKTLLEKHYSHQIRKRKLEKADILELSVKYMKSLQNSVQGVPPVFTSAEYQAGFRSCLHGVSQFLRRSDTSYSLPCHLLQELSRVGIPAGAPGFSTTDSATPPSNPEAQSPAFSRGPAAMEPWGPSPAATVLRPSRQRLLLPTAPSTAGPVPPESPQPEVQRNSTSGEGSRGQNVWRPW
ncbi:transcription factor HES-3 [Sarcophilus harrisii]|uniref:Hes family bHLH transcription factor 3 n=1 Tax=Sarcophilus harrisii TaxID=9305 RepID=A0A7N4P3P0_SARHA|nr:transcription factor HES-3 [Sarcophilus harrisii]